VGVIGVAGVLVTLGASLLATHFPLTWQIVAIIALSGAVLTLTAATLVMAIHLRQAHAYARTLNDLLKESFVVLDGLLVIRCGSSLLNDEAKLTSCLDFLMLFARDHIAPGKSKVITFLAYDELHDRFARVARCPPPSSGQSTALVSMKKDNSLAGRTLTDGDCRSYGDVTSKEAVEGGFNNALGRPRAGSLIQIPVFSHDDRPPWRPWVPMR
jgi:hypothetical protein